MKELDWDELEAGSLLILMWSVMLWIGSFLVKSNPLSPIDVLNLSVFSFFICLSVAGFKISEYKVKHFHKEVKP